MAEAHCTCWYLPPGQRPGPPPPWDPALGTRQVPARCWRKQCTACSMRSARAASSFMPPLRGPAWAQTWPGGAEGGGGAQGAAGSLPVRVMPSRGAIPLAGTALTHSLCLSLQGPAFSSWGPEPQVSQCQGGGVQPNSCTVHWRGPGPEMPSCAQVVWGVGFCRRPHLVSEWRFYVICTQTTPGEPLTVKDFIVSGIRHEEL